MLTKSNVYLSILFFIIIKFFINKVASGNPPYVPVDLRCAFNNSTQQVTLTWKQPATIPTGYYIYRDHELIDSVMNDGSQEYTYFTTLTNYGIYAFHIRAYNDDGESNQRIHRTVTWLDPDGTASSLRQWGISWIFDRDVTFGQFANGDLWVIGPVNIIGIEPACYVIDNNTIHGSMIDPYIRDGEHKQGFDSRQRTYHDSLNIGIGITNDNPLVIDAGHSLVSARSYYPEKFNKFIRTASVLTVLESEPPEGSFRPSFAAVDKTPLYNKGNITLDFLQNLSKPEEAPDIENIQSEIEKVFLDIAGSDFNTESLISPVENMEHYGRDVSAIFENVILSLNLDYSQEEKEKLAINFIQIGLDLYGLIQNSPNPQWNGWGGHFIGRKMPVLFAGIALNDTNIQNVEAHYPDLHFAENDIVYYYNDPRLPDDAINKYSWTGSKVLYKFNYCWDDPVYKAIYEHKHPADWSVDGDTVPYITDNLCESYRLCCTAKYLTGIALGARLMGFIEVWNNNAFFDYIDRWTCEDFTGFIQELNNGTGTEREVRDYGLIGNTFVRAMWNSYRNISDNEPPTIPQNVTIKETSDGSMKLIWDACGDNVGGVGYNIYKNGTIIDTVYGRHDWAVTDYNSSDYYQISAFDWTGNTTTISEINTLNIGDNNLYLLRNKLWFEIFPNPTDQYIHIRYSVNYPKQSDRIPVRIIIYNISGKEITVLENYDKPTGIYEIGYDTSQLPEGLYYCRLTAGDNSNVKKLIVTRN